SLPERIHVVPHVHTTVELMGVDAAKYHQQGRARRRCDRQIPMTGNLNTNAHVVPSECKGVQEGAAPTITRLLKSMPTVNFAQIATRNARRSFDMCGSG